MSEKLCVEVISFTTVLSSRLSPIIVHSVLFYSAALIMLRLFAQACHCSFFFSFFQSFSVPTMLSWTLVTWRKRESTMGLICQTRDTEICTERVVNNVQSKIIKLPVRLWLIFTNIWQEGFVLWICFGFRCWCLSKYQTNPNEYCKHWKNGCNKCLSIIMLHLFIICYFWLSTKWAFPETNFSTSLILSYLLYMFYF